MNNPFKDNLGMMRMLSRARKEKADAKHVVDNVMNKSLEEF
jgi:hypothetical protein